MEHEKYLTVYEYPSKIRLGNKGETVVWGHTVGDGGYVIADLSGYDCYISAGVNDEESFTRDFVKYADMGLDKCFAFDGTIVGYPYKYTSNIHFVHKNITDVETEVTTNLKYLIKPNKNIFLKMDIEGGEYPWLMSLSADELLHFKQIILEIHCPCNDEFGSPYAVKLECLKKLCQNHYLIHAHANNNGTGWGKNRFTDGIPNILELTYIRKDCVGAAELPLNTTTLPIEGLDFKNAPFDDIILNYPPFVFPKANATESI